jgi:hypothetical protein
MDVQTYIQNLEESSKNLEKAFEEGITKLIEVNYSLKYENVEVPFHYPFKGIILETKKNRVYGLDPLLDFLLDSDEELKENNTYDVPGWIIFGKYDENKVVVIRLNKNLEHLKIGDVIKVGNQVGIIKQKIGNVAYVDLNNFYSDKILNLTINSIKEISKDAEKQLFTITIQNIGFSKVKYKKDTAEIEEEYKNLHPSMIEMLLGLYPLFKNINQLKLIIKK